MPPDVWDSVNTDGSTKYTSEQNSLHAAISAVRSSGVLGIWATKTSNYDYDDTKPRFPCKFAPALSLSSLDNIVCVGNLDGESLIPAGDYGATSLATAVNTGPHQPFET